MKALYIHTQDNKKISVILENEGRKTVKEVTQGKTRAEEVLMLIDELLKQEKLDIHALQHVFVERGPGSFTGLRVGVAIANALSFALGIPINDKKLGEMEIPLYNAL